MRPSERPLLLAAVRMKLGKPADALTALDCAIRNLPEEASFWLGKADLLHGLGRLDDALHAFGEAVRIDPDLGKRLNIWASRDHPVATARAGVAAPPPELEAHPLTLAFRGGALVNSGRLSEGWNLFLRAQEIPADLVSDSLAWVASGVAKIATGRFRVGLEAFEKADELTPEMTSRLGMIVWRALALQGIHENRKALDTLAHAPRSEFACLVKAMALGELGKHEEALAVLGSVSEGDRGDGRFRTGFFESVFLMKSGRLDEASKELDVTLGQERSPLYRALLLSVKALLVSLPSERRGGVLQSALGLLPEAEAASASLPDGMPGKSMPWFAKAVLLSSFDRHEEALQAYRRCEQVEVPRASFVVSMGQSLLALEDYDQAMSCFERAAGIPEDRVVRLRSVHRAGTRFV